MTNGSSMVSVVGKNRLPAVPWARTRMGVESAMSVANISTSNTRTCRIGLPSTPNVVGESTPLPRSAIQSSRSEQERRMLCSKNQTATDGGARGEPATVRCSGG